MARQTKGRRQRNAGVRNRKRRRSRATQAIAAGAVIAGGTQAYAAPIRHDNPPGPEHFDWSGPVGQSVWLDFALPSIQQPGSADGNTSVQQLIQATNSQVSEGSAGVDIQQGGPYGLFLLGVEAESLIPSGSDWGSGPFIYYTGFGSQLPESQQTYLGVRFDLGGGFQYGWIGVVRTGLELDAFAWGYETDPGVPIPAGAPEPGTLAALALGASAVLRRRR